MGGTELTLDKCLQETNKKKVIISAIWVLCNLCYKNKESKDLIGKKGLKVLLKMCKENGEMGKQNQSEVEAALTALVNLVIDNVENCKDLLRIGGEELAKISKGNPCHKQTPGSPVCERIRLEVENNRKIASSILAIIHTCIPSTCANCYEQQDLASSTCCQHCGHQKVLPLSVIENGVVRQVSSRIGYSTPKKRQKNRKEAPSSSSVQ